jgi:hypothetical protein
LGFAYDDLTTAWEAEMPNNGAQSEVADIRTRRPGNGDHNIWISQIGTADNTPYQIITINDGQ